MSKTTYSLRPMPPAVTCKYYCSDRDKFGALCFNKATYYLVATRPNKRPSLYRRCAECARRDSAKLRIPFKEPIA